MDSSVRTQFRVEAGTPDRTLADEDRRVIVRSEHLDLGSEVEDLRCTDERARNRFVQSLHRQRCGEGFPLSTVGVAGYGDIEPAEAVEPAQRIVTEPIA